MRRSCAASGADYRCWVSDPDDPDVSFDALACLCWLSSEIATTPLGLRLMIVGLGHAPVKPPGDGISLVPAAPTRLSLLPAGGLTFRLGQARCRTPTRASGRNHRRQIVHGLFRASGIVMIHRRHHAPTLRGVRSEWLGQFWRVWGGKFCRAPKGEGQKTVFIEIRGREMPTFLCGDDGDGPAWRQESIFGCCW